MNQPQRSRRAIVWGLVGLLAIASLWLGTVHPVSRAAVAVGVFGLVGLWLRSPSRMPRVVLGLGLGASALVLAALLTIVPVSHSVRAGLQPGFTVPISLAVDRLGGSDHPLALVPHQAVASITMVASLLAAAWLTAMVMRSRTRRVRLAAGLLTVCAGVAACGLAHVVLDLPSIYGVSGLPSGPVRADFFAPFVNPNNGGLFCVVGLPLAAGIGARRDPAQNAALVGAGALCLAGVIIAGSRGAMAAGGAAAVVFVCVSAPRGVALATAAGTAAVGVCAAMMGPTRLLEVLTAYAMPGAVSPQPDGGRTEIWSVAWQIALDAPWVGVGAGCFSSAWRVVETGSRFGDAIHAHNDALQVWAEQGFILGSGWLLLLILPLVLVAGHLRSLRRGRRRRMLAGYTAAYVAMLVASLVSFPAHIGALALLAALLIGGLIGAVSQDRRPAGPVADRVGRGFLMLHALLGLGLVASGVAGGPGPKLSDTHAELDAALAGAPLWSRGWLQRAELHVADGSPTDALLDLEVAAAAWPTSPWPHVARARLLRRMGRIDASRTAWRTALALNFPDNDPGRKWIEAALDGEPTPMAALFLIVPNRADRLRDAGAVARAAGDGLNATVFFQRAYELDPSYGLPLVRQLLFDGFVPDARRTFDTVPAVATQSCRGRVLEAEIDLLSGAYDAALSAARAAIRVCGESDEAAWVVLVRARLGSGDRGAMVPMAKLVEQYPMRHGLRRALVGALRAGGDHAELAVHLRALVQSGVATDAERADLDRIQRGLPPQIRP